MLCKAFLGLILFVSKWFAIRLAIRLVVQCTAVETSNHDERSLCVSQPNWFSARPKLVQTASPTSPTVSLVNCLSICVRTQLAFHIASWLWKFLGLMWSSVIATLNFRVLFGGLDMHAESNCTYLNIREQGGNIVAHSWMSCKLWDASAASHSGKSWGPGYAREQFSHISQQVPSLSKCCGPFAKALSFPNIFLSKVWNNKTWSTVISEHKALPFGFKSSSQRGKARKAKANYHRSPCQSR